MRDRLILWALLSALVALLASIQDDPCQAYPDGSDGYVQCVFQDDELDLTPMKGD